MCDGAKEKVQGAVREQHAENRKGRMRSGERMERGPEVNDALMGRGSTASENECGGESEASAWNEAARAQPDGP
eukprot:364195-Chlamydomonas_euryale.AAC.17